MAAMWSNTMPLSYHSQPPAPFLWRRDWADSLQDARGNSIEEVRTGPEESCCQKGAREAVRRLWRHCDRPDGLSLRITPASSPPQSPRSSSAAFLQRRPELSEQWQAASGGT